MLDESSGYTRISESVCTHMGLKGSSACSATAISARITGSDKGTVFEAVKLGEYFGSDPISTIVRMSLIACSFSTACLLSRVSDLMDSDKYYRRGKPHDLLQNVPVQGMVSQTFH